MLSFCCCGHVTSSPGLRSSFSSTPSLLPPSTVWQEVTSPSVSPVLPGVPVRGCRHWLSFISRHCVRLLNIQWHLAFEISGSITNEGLWTYWDTKQNANFPMSGHFIGHCEEGVLDEDQCHTCTHASILVETFHQSAVYSCIYCLVWSPAAPDCPDLPLNRNVCSFSTTHKRTQTRTHARALSECRCVRQCRRQCTAKGHI